MMMVIDVDDIKLAESKDDYNSSGVCGATRGILNILETFEKTEHEQRVKQVLKSLAIDGFAPLLRDPVNDLVAREISKNNIGGVVEKGYLIAGLPKTVWNGKYS